MSENVVKRNATDVVREYLHYIDGKYVASTSGQLIRRTNPATGLLTAMWQEGTVADVDLAVSAANRAFDDGSWSGLTASKRSDVLRAVSRRLREDWQDLAVIESLETGKTLVQASGEVPWAGDIWDFAAGQARSLRGDSHANLGSEKIALTLKEPIGPVGLITPWNYPIVVLSQKLPFALAAGCTVVVKPSELTSGTTLEIAKILEEAGLPKGVFNVVTGFGDVVGKRIAEHPDLRMVSFTGSTATGQSIVRAAAGNMKKVVLELGGKNPTVIFADANLEAAADGAIKGFVYNSGAECCSGSRVFVQKAILPVFIELLRKNLSSVTVGDPLEPTTTMGAIISDMHFAKIQRYIAEGKRLGQVAFGGNTLAHLPGFFVEPTVLTNIDPSATVAREEIFGPVIVIIPFDETSDAIRLANDTEYGLAASIWTSDLETAMTMARKVRSGIVWLNTFLDVPSEVPIGGTRQSGYGRENGQQAIEEFTVTKTVVIQNASSFERYLG